MSIRERTINNRKVELRILSFLIPIVIMTIAYKFLNQWPFGDKSLLPFWDIREQYSNYFEYLKTILSGENNFIYTFSKVLGGDIIGLTGYYMSSPFNILFLILKNLKLEITILIITLLKIGMCGLTFNIFICKKSNVDFFSLIFSTSYALMAYNIVYQQNIMWVDGVIWLPIVVIGVDKIIESKSFMLYVVSLSFMILSNYYIGYMVGFFSILYYWYKVLCLDENRGNVKYKIKNFLNFLRYAFISIGVTAFFLFPVFESLQGGKGPKALENNLLLSFSFLFNPVSFISKFYTGAFSWHEVMDGYPLVFIGWVCVATLILYFINSSFSKRERIISFVFMILLILSMQIQFLVVIWHGFNIPTGFPARNSFIFSFFILFLGYKGFKNICHNHRIRHFILCLTLFLISTVATLVSKLDYVEAKVIVWSSVCFMLAITFMFILCRVESDNSRKVILSLVMMLSFLDIGLNAYMCLSKYSFDSIDSIDNFIKENKPPCEYIKNLEGDNFYRMEKNYMRTRNDNMMLNIDGVSHYSSCEKNQVKIFFRDLGLDSYEEVYATYGRGGTMFVDSLLGIKYLLSRSKPNDYYNIVESFGEVSIYENPYVLPVAFLANKSAIEDMSWGKNRFLSQNNIISSVLGKRSEIFLPCENVKSETENLEVNLKKKIKHYSKIQNNLDASLKYTFTAERVGPIYADFITPMTSNAIVEVNENEADLNFSNQDKTILRLGEFNIGDTVTILLKPTGKRMCIEDVYIYYEDVDKLKSLTDNIKKQKCTFKKVTSSELAGEIEAEKDETLIVSVPYEKAWRIWIDGEKNDTYKIYDALLATNITKGKHSVKMEYIPTTFFAGLLITISSIIILLFLWIRSRFNFSDKVIK